jgi:hypothetical protein
LDDAKYINKKEARMIVLHIKYNRLIFSDSNAAKVILIRSGSGIK